MSFSTSLRSFISDVRASFAFYNTKEEIDVMIEAVIKAKKMLQ